MRRPKPLSLSGIALACFLAGFWLGRNTAPPVPPPGPDEKKQPGPGTEGPLVLAGLPLGTQSADVAVLHNQAYVVGYSDERRCPLWAAFRLFRVERPRSYDREDYMRIDQRTAAKVKHEDYQNTGYDRGHMAPNYAIAIRFGDEAADETFLMTNICPQRPDFNRKIWKMLEQKVSRDWANRFEEIWVTTGPVFSDRKNTLPSGVHIPAAFYKIVATLNPATGQPRLIAFLIPQTADSEGFDSYVSTVDEIEEQTGLDFFITLEDELEEALESQGPDAEWNINRFDPNWLMAP